MCEYIQRIHKNQKSKPKIRQSRSFCGYQKPTQLLPYLCYDRQVMIYHIPEKLLMIRVPDGADTSDLVAAVENVVQSGVKMISVPYENVAITWAWLEKTDVQIICRIGAFSSLASLAENDNSRPIEKLSEQINTSFKNGAAAAQIDLALSDLAQFCTEILPIRDDLFFNKKLIIGLDIAEIEPDDWPRVFENLLNVGADAVMLRGAPDDIVGRIYSLLTSIERDFTSDIYFEFLSAEQMEQAYRLTQKIQPEIIERLMFFV